MRIEGGRSEVGSQCLVAVVVGGRPSSRRLMRRVWTSMRSVGERHRSNIHTTERRRGREQTQPKTKVRKTQVYLPQTLTLLLRSVKVRSIRYKDTPELIIVLLFYLIY